MAVDIKQVIKMKKLINMLKENLSLFFIFLLMIGVPFFIWNIWIWHYILHYMEDNLNKYFVLEDYLYLPTWILISCLISLFWMYTYIKITKKNIFWWGFSIFYILYILYTIIELLLPFGAI
mgnify:CR=1 FL=1